MLTPKKIVDKYVLGMAKVIEECIKQKPNFNNVYTFMFGGYESYRHDSPYDDTFLLGKRCSFHRHVEEFGNSLSQAELQRRDFNFQNAFIQYQDELNKYLKSYGWVCYNGIEDGAGEIVDGSADSTFTIESLD
jgi:hypothetical protein